MRREGQESFQRNTTRIAPLPCQSLLDEGNLCRICFEPHSKDLPLIAPCKCSGSVKYIHEECLKTWIISQDTDLDEGRCELCMTHFLMEFKIARKFSPKDSVKNGWSAIFFLPISIIAMITLFVIIFLLASKYISVSQDNSDRGYGVALMITCGISGVVLLLLIVNTLKEVCFVRILDEWHIYSQVFDRNSEEIFPESKHETVLIDRISKGVLIVPETLTVKGIRVKTPEIRPSLIPLIQRGRTVGFTSHSCSPFQDLSFSFAFQMRTDPCH